VESTGPVDSQLLNVRLSPETAAVQQSEAHYIESFGYADYKESFGYVNPLASGRGSIEAGMHPKLINLI
jgi:hypothetical protein